jgi:hypothetical protein
MSLNGVLFPRLGATSDELKTLGRAIQHWFTAFLQEHPAMDGWLDHDAVDDLLHGELPQPLAGRCLRIMHGITIRELIGSLAEARERHPALRRLMPEPEARCVSFGFSLGEEAHDDLLASLRVSLPPKAIAEIRINGQNFQPRR